MVQTTTRQGAAVFQFRQANILFALISCGALILVSIQAPANAEKGYFLATISVFVAAAIVAARLRLKLDQVFEAASIARLIEDARIEAVDQGASPASANLLTSSTYATLFIWLFVALLSGMTLSISTGRGLPSLVVLILAEAAYFLAYFETCKKADEFKAIADNWSQRLQERPDARLPRVCADRARQLHAGLP